MSTDQKADDRELTEEVRAAQIRTLLESQPLPMIQKSIDAFRRDLPEMLETHHGTWVAYHGDTAMNESASGELKPNLSRNVSAAASRGTISSSAAWTKGFSTRTTRLRFPRTFEAGRSQLTAIIRSLPFFERLATVEVRGHSVPVRQDLVTVWVSILEIGLRELDPRTPRFPAVVDTGCNHSFAIPEQHLVQWAGAHPECLRRLRPTRIYGSLAPQLAANVWRHPNRPGHRDEFSGQPPFPVECEAGIAVVPESAGDGNPRLPLLGLPAFRRNRLYLAVDGNRQRVVIRTRRKFWILG
jgi:hypothetical protein